MENNNRRLEEMPKYLKELLLVHQVSIDNVQFIASTDMLSEGEFGKN
jgi:hypothetical protein